MIADTANHEAEPLVQVRDKILVSIAEAAALWSISERTMHELIKIGRVQVVRIGRRVLVPRAELDAAWQDLEPDA